MTEADPLDHQTASMAVALLTSTEKDIEKKCHLLALPRELRDMIIEEALWILHYTAYEYLGVRSNTVVQPALALVNQQLRAETLPIFYSTRPFRIDSLQEEGQWEKAEHWLNAIQPHLHMIKKIEICLCQTHNCVLEIKATPGTKAAWNLRFHDEVEQKASRTPKSGGVHVLQAEKVLELRDLYMEFVERCDYEKVDDATIRSVQSLCDNVGLDGFVAEQYIRAGEFFLFPSEKRCSADYYPSDMEYDSDESD